MTETNETAAKDGRRQARADADIARASNLAGRTFTDVAEARAFLKRYRRLRAVERANRLPGPRVRTFGEAQAKLRKRRLVAKEERALEESYAPVQARLDQIAETKRVTEIIQAEKQLERVMPKLVRAEREKRAAQPKKPARGRGKRKAPPVTLPSLAGTVTETWVEPHVTMGRVQVKVTSRGSGIRGLLQTRTIQKQHERAALQFARDFEATLSGLRCRGFDPGVDGGGAIGAGLPAAVAAQERLRELKRKIGDRAFFLVFAVVVMGANPSKLHELGGEEHVRIGQDIRRALDGVIEFYTGRRLRDRTFEAATKWIEKTLQGRDITFDQILLEMA